MEESLKRTSSSASEDINVAYANNVFFEGTIWDLKLIFGEVSARSNTVGWHTSVTIPWAQAKLMQYYLAVNIEAHERINGKISFPTAMTPKEPPPPDPSDTTGDKKDFYDMVMRLRQNFIDSLK
jgi:hypothetical protein